MIKPKTTPLLFSAILIVLICTLSAIRMNHQSLWKSAILNVDIALALVYILAILFESKVSIRDAVTKEKNSDFGTCELYALGQGGVITSALWFTPAWDTPNMLHGLGFLMFIGGLIFRGWAIVSLGEFYSHKVRKVEAHQIITSGPYRYIRHPAYAGMLMANAGIVVYFLNTVTLLLYLLILLPAILLRIIIEEKTLFKNKDYAKFANTKKRLIPSLW